MSLNKGFSLSKSSDWAVGADGLYLPLREVSRSMRRSTGLKCTIRDRLILTGAVAAIGDDRKKRNRHAQQCRQDN